MNPSLKSSFKIILQSSYLTSPQAPLTWPPWRYEYLVFVFIYSHLFPYQCRVACVSAGDACARVRVPPCHVVDSKVFGALALALGESGINTSCDYFSA